MKTTSAFRYSKLALALALAGTLAACNSSDSDDDVIIDPPPPVGKPNTDMNVWVSGVDPSAEVDSSVESRLTGAVFYYGPVEGAEVCIDTTRDFTCDEDSPTTLTDLNGDYDLQVETNFEGLEYHVLARFPVTELGDDTDGVEVFSDGDDVVLSARAIYRGTINPLTSIEAQQYNSELPYLRQVERFAIGRTLLTRLFELPVNYRLDQLYAWADSDDTDISELTTRMQNSLNLYANALAVTESPDAALLVATNVQWSGAGEAAISGLATWQGHIGGGAELSDSQLSAAAQDVALTDRPVSLDMNYWMLTITNEPAQENVAVERWADQVRVYINLPEELAERTEQLCWNEGEQAWFESDRIVRAYSDVSEVSPGVYQATHEASGEQTEIAYRAISPESDGYSAAVLGWDTLLDLSDAQIDGALVGPRVTRADEFCIGDYVRVASSEQAFSDLSGDELVRYININLFQQNLYEVDEDLQRMSFLTSPRAQVDYRIFRANEYEVLVTYPLIGSMIDSQMRAWIWYDGQVYNSDFISPERFEMFQAQEPRFLIDDAAAVDLATQAKPLDNRP